MKSETIMNIVLGSAAALFLILTIALGAAANSEHKKLKADTKGSATYDSTNKKYYGLVIATVVFALLMTGTLVGFGIQIFRHRGDIQAGYKGAMAAMSPATPETLSSL